MQNSVVKSVTQKIIDRSKESRRVYIQRMEEALKDGVSKGGLSCSNIAHAQASMERNQKERFLSFDRPNIAIITAYNDMLSAHEPYRLYPPLIKRVISDLGATAQVAGAVAAMCDGITQSQPGMELSLFSRDNIAMGCAIGLAHNVFDAAIYLGVCDKIVPGLLMGALSFGHLPAIFVPSGPMSFGISNKEKAKVREEYAKGEVDRDAMQKVESASYHSSGTCTFYGTANSNQMLLEIMGLQLPNSSFVNTNTPLREMLTQQAAKEILKMTKSFGEFKPLYKIIDERSFVNAIIGLLATGGSTNHTMHLIAMARVAGIILDWEDFDALSSVTPLLCRLYPNGDADVNRFRDAGGMATVIHELLRANLLHKDVETVIGKGLRRYIVEPTLKDGNLLFIEGAKKSRDKSVISDIDTPFSREGGLKMLDGNIGKSVIKTSALKDEHLFIKAPAIVFNSQEELQQAFKDGKLERDFVAVVRFQGPKANGMPELHSLMPYLGVLQDRGFRVAIVTDGRMSGASGKVPSAIHLSPEAIEGGVLAKIEDGDEILFDVKNKKLELLVDERELNLRKSHSVDLSRNHYGFGRELFATIRQSISSAKEGATIFDIPDKERA